MRHLDRMRNPSLAGSGDHPLSVLTPGKIIKARSGVFNGALQIRVIENYRDHAIVDLDYQLLDVPLSHLTQLQHGRQLKIGQSVQVQNQRDPCKLIKFLSNNKATVRPYPRRARIFHYQTRPSSVTRATLAPTSTSLAAIMGATGATCTNVNPPTAPATTVFDDSPMLSRRKMNSNAALVRQTAASRSVHLASRALSLRDPHVKDHLTQLPYHKGMYRIARILRTNTEINGLDIDLLALNELTHDTFLNRRGIIYTLTRA